jgi:2-keto-4-pentenoate hydratase/2-oxohepta-3-ene-1,7-dioic acid hydratase in catechol pathway
MKRRDFIKVTAAGSAGISLLSMSNPEVADAENFSASKDAAQMASGYALANLRTAAGNTLAVKTSKGILDAVKAAKIFGKKIPLNTDALVLHGPSELKDLINTSLKSATKGLFYTEANAAFAPCVTNPKKIICIGLNYKKHAQELKLAEPPMPILFNKYLNTLNHHRGSVKTAGLPGNHFDYEGELVIVMGKYCKNVSEQNALNYVFGYCTGNDFSERTYQMATSQWMPGKSSDGFAPIGPYLLTGDLVGDPNNLKLETRVNGELRQSSNTNDLIFNCQKLVSFISQFFALEPNDIIFTGTPSGVIQGYAPEKQVWLKAGDKVQTTIEKLGTLDFTVA